jgi:hypothetical protein
MLCLQLICLFYLPFNDRLIRKLHFQIAQLYNCDIRYNILGTEKSGSYTQLQFWRLILWHQVMVGNKHELCLWRTKHLVLAGNSWLVILWKIIASCIELACTCYQTPDRYSRFSGGNKLKNFYFIISSQVVCLTFQLLCLKKWFNSGNYIHYSILPYALSTTELHLTEYT